MPPQIVLLRLESPVTKPTRLKVAPPRPLAAQSVGAAREILSMQVDNRLELSRAILIRVKMRMADLGTLPAMIPARLLTILIQNVPLPC